MVRLVYGGGGGGGEVGGIGGPRSPQVRSGLVIDVGRPAQSVALSIQSIQKVTMMRFLDGG